MSDKLGTLSGPVATPFYTDRRVQIVAVIVVAAVAYHLYRRNQLKKKKQLAGEHGDVQSPTVAHSDAGASSSAADHASSADVASYHHQYTDAASS